MAVPAAVVLASCGSIVATSVPGPTTTAVPGPTVVLGYLGPITGSRSPLGAALLDGVRLAVQQYDGAGPAVPVRLVEADTASDPRRAAAAATRLVDAGAVAVVGPATNAEAVAADPVLEAARVPQLVVSATADGPHPRPGTGFHRLSADDAAAGADVAAFVSHQGATSAAVVDDGTASAAPLLSALRVSLASDGITDVLDPSLVPPGLGATQLAATIVSAAPASVVYAGDAPTGGLLVSALRAASYPGTIVLAGAAGDPGAARVQAWAGAPGDQAYLACACDDPGSTGADLAFVDAYRGAWGVAPPEWAAQAFDAANAVLGLLGRPVAVGAAASTTVTTGVPPTAPPIVDTRAEVRRALASSSSTGVSGTVTFDAAGERVAPPVWISHVRDGTVTQIGASTAPTPPPG